MVTRAEAAATTRTALLAAASDLLDTGGPDAVTLRAVAARVGVSRGAPYGHFENKEALLARLAIDAWTSLAQEVERLRAAPGPTPAARLEGAVSTLVGVARRRPHLYALMFSTPADEPQAAQAAGRLQRAFLDIVADVVGPSQALSYAALLMSSAHGIAGLEVSGHLSKEKWTVDGDELVRLLIAAIASAR
ncbi:TetR/AcrR family transcriptional regulator [Cellulomonas phragmiteti]|uniref:TetR family transcriptional regulator n=1 Tax=Cellulomonas phragmiteti TaxID=478780 RepID=A0ABQ4DNL2_9CELL|nr:TetR/AcrR family transcriptional regulator [Cellulomonas phragmiteti]GIG40930.1 TetR family transcriptional regulator [Cellulomonas phragmiteti]